MADNRTAKAGRNANKLPQHIAEQIAQLAREARVELYGTDGIPEWGTKFIDIQDQGLEVGEQLAQAFIEQSVAGQAQQSPPEHALKVDEHTTASPTEATKDSTVFTPAGDVRWNQPVAQVNGQTADFFPSSQSARP